MRQNSLLLSMLPALVAAGPGINPNPNPNFNPSTSKGTFGPFIIPQAPSVAATGGPKIGSVDARTLQAMQLAISNWQTDTGIVSLFQNNGANIADPQQFKGIADGAFKAEVNELVQKGVLDQVIGNDPRVSLANLTLTNGVFQSVVDNLQIMSLQGQSRVNLIDAINQVRCTQVLPSIDTYMLIAAEYIGDNAQQRRAVRPNACAGILATANSSAIPAVPGAPQGTPVGKGDGIVSGVPNACGQGSGLAALGIGMNTTSSNSNSGSGKGGSSNSGSGVILPPLNNATTPNLGLPAFSGSSGTPTTGSSGTSPTTSKGSSPNGSKGSSPSTSQVGSYNNNNGYHGGSPNGSKSSSSTAPVRALPTAATGSYSNSTLVSNSTLISNGTLSSSSPAKVSSKASLTASAASTSSTAKGASNGGYGNRFRHGGFRIRR